jgi:acyl-coenzyme A thioesterase PaaI-like protein
MGELRHVDNCVGCGSVATREGAPGLVHGGLLATLADEVRGCLPSGGDAVLVTPEMTICHLRPTPTETVLCCRASAIERSERTFPRACDHCSRR